MNATPQRTRIGREAPAGLALRESHTRSLAKGITYRLLGTLTTIAIAWGITGQADVALQIGFLDVFAKVAVYYVHERAWARIPLGLDSS